jgi:hypothetical protein
MHKVGRRGIITDSTSSCRLVLHLVARVGSKQLWNPRRLVLAVLLLHSPEPFFGQSRNFCLPGLVTHTYLQPDESRPCAHVLFFKRLYSHSLFV